MARNASAETLAAVRGQTSAAGEVVGADGSWHDAVAGAQASGAPWVWLVEEGVVPHPDALERLAGTLDALGDLPSPALLAGRVVTADGALHASSAPWMPLLDRRVVIDAAQRRLVSLRVARWGSLLVHRSALEAHGPPRADLRAAADIEWTARILRAAPGYLVPSSVATRAAEGAAVTVAELPERARLLRSAAWVRPESAWLAYLTAQQALAAARASGRRAGRGARSRQRRARSG